jgi:peptidoglycan/xylan/chitin deacetylase (PgdA/CDA1 family)
MRIVNKLRSTVKQSLFVAGIPLNIILKEQKNYILLYHGVTPDKLNPFNSRHTYIKDFENQIRYLATHANIVSVKDFFNQKFDNSKCNIAITFDDAFHNNLLYAFPILDKYNVPFTLFSTCLYREEKPVIFADFIQIVSHFTDKPLTVSDNQFLKKNNQYYRTKDGVALIDLLKSEKLNVNHIQEIYSQWQPIFDTHKSNTSLYWQLMTKQQLIQASKTKNLTIGSHTCAHNNMENIPLENAIHDLRKSKNTLEELIQKEVDEFAYPYGLFSDEIVIEAEKLGYKYQLGTENNKIDSYTNHPVIKGRKGIYQCDSWGNQLI